MGRRTKFFGFQIEPLPPPRPGRGMGSCFTSLTDFIATVGMWVLIILCCPCVLLWGIFGSQPGEKVQPALTEEEEEECIVPISPDDLKPDGTSKFGTSNLSPEWCAIVDAELSGAGLKVGNSSDVCDMDAALLKGRACTRLTGRLFHDGKNIHMTYRYGRKLEGDDVGKYEDTSHTGALMGDEASRLRTVRGLIARILDIKSGRIADFQTEY